MKRHLINTAALALIATALTALSAKANPDNTGDLYVGFEEAGSANDYIVDLGADSLFTNTATLTFNLSAADLSAFGSLTSSSTGLVYGVFGGSPSLSAVNGFAPKTQFLTVVAGSAAPKLGSSSSSTIPNAIQGTELAYSQQTASTGSTVALPAAFIATSNGSSLTSENFAGGTGGAFGHTFSATTSNSDAPTSDILDLYFLPTGSVTANGTELGTFSLASNGVLTYDGVAAATPEPSTYALLGMGVTALLFWSARRRSVSTK